MELATNGTLLNFVNNLHTKAREPFSEKLARFFFKKLVDGLNIMHSRDFVHLDIKHDNIMLDMDLNPKLADFGFTKKVNGPIKFDRYSPNYAPPEVDPLTRPYPFVPYDGKKADIYSMGVVFYSAFNLCWPPSSSEEFKFPKVISADI